MSLFVPIVLICSCIVEPFHRKGYIFHDLCGVYIWLIYFLCICIRLFTDDEYYSIYFLVCYILVLWLICYLILLTFWIALSCFLFRTPGKWPLHHRIISFDFHSFIAMKLTLSCGLPFLLFTSLWYRLELVWLNFFYSFLD